MFSPNADLMRTQLLLRRCGFLFAVSGVVCVAYILFQENPSGTWNAFFPKCMFFWATGWHCPGCGCQRAIHYLLNGQILLALHSNAMVIIALPWLTWEAIRASLLYLELPLPRFMAIRRRLSGKQAMSIAVAVTAFWILRNVPGPPFEWLAPPMSLSRTNQVRSQAAIPAPWTGMSEIWSGVEPLQKVSRMHNNLRFDSVSWPYNGFACPSYSCRSCEKPRMM